MSAVENAPAESGLLPCCADPKNRGEEERLSDDLTFRRCVVCQRRHFELTVDPGRMGLRGGSL